MLNYLRYPIKWAIIFILPAILHFSNLSAQCPDEKDLMARLNANSTISLKEQNREFLPALDSVNKCPSVNDTVKALLLKKIGANYFYDYDNVNALKYYSEFIKIAANGGRPTIQIKNLVVGYFYLSMILRGLNRSSEALIAFDSCIAVADRYNYVDGTNLRVIYTKLERYFDAGDYYNCINYCIKCEILAARRVKETSGAERDLASEFLSSSFLWRIKALLELKKYDEVEKILAIEFNEYKKKGHKRYYGTLYSQLAELEEHRGNYSKALDYYKNAIICDKASGYNFNCKQTAKDIATKIYVKHYSDISSALYSYKNAFTYINKDKAFLVADAFESLDIYAGIGNLYVLKGSFDSAHYYFQLAFDQLKPGMNESLILKDSPEGIRLFKKIHYVTSLVIDKADAYRKQYMQSNQPELLKEAIRVYKSADLLLDRVKMEQLDLDSKLFWRLQSRRLYENAIDACFISGNTKDAFYFFEKSRAVLLNDQLVNQHWLNQDDISMQTSINKRIIRLEKEIENTDPQAETYRELQQQLIKSNQELEHFDLLIKKNNPLYYQSFLDTATVTIADARDKLLNNHEALVEIFEGDSAVYTISITGSDAQINKIGKKAFDDISNKFISYIADPVVLNQHFDEFVKVSRKLYALIFKDKTLPPGRIIISPSGRYFPFEALITNADRKPVKYFLDDYAVSYTYSARFLLNQFETNTTASSKNFMGIAPVKYTPVFKMSTLTGSENSLERIESLLGNGNSLVYQQATRSNFLQQFPGYKIIQLYTHASDSSDNREPVIYFADSAMYLSELIPDVRPVTQLMVLSACETGNGIDYQGEGVFSFNRGFASLGIPSSVMNLWSVDNESTYKLNELFYKYLSEGLTLDIALQKAKKEYIQSGSQKNALPYYWAAAVLAGKSDAINYSKPFPWKHFLIVFIFTAVSYTIWLRRKNKMF